MVNTTALDNAIALARTVLYDDFILPSDHNQLRLCLIEIGKILKTL